MGRRVRQYSCYIWQKWSESWLVFRPPGMILVVQAQADDLGWAGNGGPSRTSLNGLQLRRSGWLLPRAKLIAGSPILRNAIISAEVKGLPG